MTCRDIYYDAPSSINIPLFLSITITNELYCISLFLQIIIYTVIIINSWTNYENTGVDIKIMHSSSIILPLLLKITMSKYILLLKESWHCINLWFLYIIIIKLVKAPSLCLIKSDTNKPTIIMLLQTMVTLVLSFLLLKESWYCINLWFLYIVRKLFKAPSRYKPPITVLLQKISPLVKLVLSPLYTELGELRIVKIQLTGHGLRPFDFLSKPFFIISFTSSLPNFKAASCIYKINCVLERGLPTCQDGSRWRRQRMAAMKIGLDWSFSFSNPEVNT